MIPAAERFSVAGVLLFGGSFDPIHNGHLIVARHVARRIEAQCTVLIPAATPPHKLGRVLASPADRLEMCRLAAAGDPGLRVSDWELHQTGPNYTLLTVRHFRAELGPAAPLYWLIGLDSLAELSTWYRVADLAAECTLVTAGRPGVAGPRLESLTGLIPPEQIERLRANIVDAPLVDISSTEVRTRVRMGQSIANLVPAPVEQYIRSRGIYAA